MIVRTQVVIRCTGFEVDTSIFQLATPLATQGGSLLTAQDGWLRLQQAAGKRGVRRLLRKCDECAHVVLRREHVLDVPAGQDELELRELLGALVHAAV